ncbi:MAG: deoxyribonuclease V [Verrucomicrobia bacterium]|nr:MAG: deoxyribonuclease V [Verrucomicrobiota bacterium]
MRIAHQQRWNLTPRAAIAQQQRLRKKVIPRLPQPLPSNPLVAGTDVSYDQGSDQLFAAVVVLQLPELKIVAQATTIDRARFPYVPGLLSFREAPALLRCFRKLACVPDVVMVDGQGLAHPRRFGLACHLGWLLELPTFGCAKSILCGSYGPLASRRGATAPLVHNQETIGVALRTRAGVQPVYVSIGHRIDLPSAVDLALRCAPRWRIPEPTRQAHILVNQLRLAG